MLPYGKKGDADSQRICASIKHQAQIRELLKEVCLQRRLQSFVADVTKGATPPLKEKCAGQQGH